MSKPEATVTAIATAPTTVASAMTMPAEGSIERARFVQAAADMTDVLVAAENNSRAIVLWHGTERVAADLVRAWRKLAQTAEAERLKARATK